MLPRNSMSPLCSALFGVLALAACDQGPMALETTQYASKNGGVDEDVLIADSRRCEEAADQLALAREGALDPIYDLDIAYAVAEGMTLIAEETLHRLDCIDDVPVNPQPEPYSCPPGFVQTTNGDDLAFCLVTEIILPTPNAKPYCEYLKEGYIGFHWERSRSPYECPEGSRQTTNDDGVSFCLWEDLQLPDSPELAAYCHYLHEGYIGFHWPQQTD